MNSIGNGLVVDPDLESVVIKPKHGFGGIGDFIKPTALANVHNFILCWIKAFRLLAVAALKPQHGWVEHILCGAKCCANRHPIYARRQVV